MSGSATSRTLGVLFVREGSSDDGLIGLLTAVFLENKDFQAKGLALDIASFSFLPQRKNLRKALEDVAREFPDKRIVVVHRDADNAGANHRLNEIEQAAVALTESQEVVPVIPVKETEAWILHALHSDEYCQRIGVDPSLFSGNVPDAKSVPKVNAKERLSQIHEALLPPHTGRRRRRRPKFEVSRTRWLEKLDQPSFLKGNESFEELRTRVGEVLRYL